MELVELGTLFEARDRATIDLRSGAESAGGDWLKGRTQRFRRVSQFSFSTSPLELLFLRKSTLFEATKFRKS